MKTVIIVGPTASGKTALGINLAQKYNGEILSADSKQVYKYMDIGTGKDVRNFQFSIFNFQAGNPKYTYGYYNVEGIKIWGLDIVAPDYSFSVADYLEYATVVLRDIWNRGKFPIIVGGTGQYIRALISAPETIGVPQNKRLREKLSRHTVAQLQKKLVGIGRNKWESMNQSDRNNPRRLVRAIEIADWKKTHHYNYTYNHIKVMKDNTLILGLTAPYQHLYRRIDKRVDKRVGWGIVEEIKGLLTRGYSWDLPSMSGFGYREFRNFQFSIFNFQVRNKELEEIVRRWKYDEHDYARRQLTYLKKYFPEAVWFDISKSYKQEVTTLVTQFLH